MVIGSPCRELGGEAKMIKEGTWGLEKPADCILGGCYLSGRFLILPISRAISDEDKGTSSDGRTDY